jgi:uncharacterized OB-fold protein
MPRSTIHHDEIVDTAAALWFRCTAMTVETARAPIAPDLFTWPSDEPRLVGGICAECGAVAFPRPSSCSRCTSERIAEHLLARTGTLWSWTIQRFQPKEPYVGPEPFEPYGVGYVDLGDVIVEGRLTSADPRELEIGLPMELAIVPFGDMVTFAFAPSAER